MLQSSFTEDREPVTVTLSEIYDAQGLVNQVIIPDEVLEVLWELRTKLAENDVFTTDRRFHQSLAIIQAEAFLNGRERAEVVDTKPLQYVMWRDISQIDFVRRAVLDLADPLEKDALQLLSDIEALFTQFQAATKDSTNTSQKMNISVEAWGKLKNIKTEINEAIRRVPVVADPAVGMPQTKKTKHISLSHISKRIQSKEDVDVIIATFSKLKDNWNEDEVIDIKW
jgi:hypothetical protein